ncbi:MAG TPA: hypothetical protein VM425_02950 [Myxococcota bacterium]|nr:hypothetical protein [Myxococcota bacterium]
MSPRDDDRRGRLLPGKRASVVTLALICLGWSRLAAGDVIITEDTDPTWAWTHSATRDTRGTCRNFKSPFSGYAHDL